MEVPAAISIQEARDIIAANVKPGRIEVVPVVDALKRVIARSLTSDINVTPFEDSAMDGFAVRVDDLAAATIHSPVSLRCVAHIGAGSHYDEFVTPGQCIRIMTGAPVPDGANAVVKIENTTFTDEGLVGDTITFTAPTKNGANIRKAGEEARTGDVVVTAGDVVLPAGVGLLASTGNLEVPVYARPKVGILSIGSELIDANEIPGPGMVRNSNCWSMSAYVRDAGGIPKLYPTCVDDENTIRATIRCAIDECDIVVSTGGACMGDYDLTPQIVSELGTILYSRISMKPGKSQPFGMIDGKPIFVLSGNPGASSVGFEMLVRPALLLLQGYRDIDRPIVQAYCTFEQGKRESRVFLQRGTLAKDTDGNYIVSQYHNQSSGLYGSLQHANCLIVLPEGKEGKHVGDMVDCILTDVSERAPL